MPEALRLPRYTSYPTAPHFQELDENAVIEALGRTTGPLSVYVHVPFCKQLCWYCGCHREIRRRPQSASPYVDDLLWEVGLINEHMGGGATVRQLALGGGTPSFLLPRDLERLVGAITSVWPRSSDAEWSMEVDPRSVDGDRLAELVELGFNRFSLGVQDVHPRVMRAVHREQPRELSEELIEVARRHDGVGVSIDLMYGLPHQTEVTWAETLRWAVDQGPDRLSVFPYAHVPWMQPQQKLIEPNLPEPELRVTMREMAREALAEAGYVRIGMDHFARPADSLVLARDAGTLQRNFQGYSTHRGLDMIGLGASAIGSYGGIYAQNTKSLVDYRERLAEGRLPVERGVVLSGEDRLRREVIMDLLCRFQTRFADHGATAADFEDELSRLHVLEKSGLVEFDDEGVRVLPAGRDQARRVAAVFDTHLGRGDARYSRVD